MRLSRWPPSGTFIIVIAIKTIRPKQVNLFRIVRQHTILKMPAGDGLRQNIPLLADRDVATFGRMASS